MEHFVLKIGGTSLADSACFKQVKSLAESEPAYTIFVPSAPANGTARMTEMLRSLEQATDRSEIYWKLDDWLVGIVRGLSLNQATEDWVRIQIIELAHYIDTNAPNWAYVISRGEFWSGNLLARHLKIPYVDPADVIRFTLAGTYDEFATKRAMDAYPLPKKFVMSGFYGADKRGRVHLFPPNGSDISAAIIAVQTKAGRLDIGRIGVPGVYAMNPNLYDGSRSQLKVIRYLSHEQGREMTYRSDSALQPLALIPLAKAKIPVRTFAIDRPGDHGTHIVCAGHPELPKRWQALGIAERAGFTVFSVKRIGLNERTDFLKRVSGVLDEFGIGHEHQATGVDHVSLIIKNDDLRSRQEEVATSLRKACRAEVTYIANEASVCIVGHDLGSSPRDLGRLLTSLGTNALCERPCPDMKLSFQSQGLAGTSIVFGVPSDSMRNAVNRLYKEIFRVR